MADLYYPDSVRRIEREMISSGIKEVELVFRAAKSVSERLDEKLSYAVVCGKGNNGADGFCLAELLFKKGAKVKAYRVSEKMSEAEAYYFDRCKKIGVSEDFTGYAPLADVVVDCVFGIGFHGEISGEYLSAVEKINEMRAAGAKVYSIDVPSGLNAFNGIAKVAVKADKTFVLGYDKTGLHLNDAKDCVGNTVFIDMGFPPALPDVKLLKAKDVRNLLKPRKNNSNKYDYGFVGIMGGSENYSGAAKLANIAAVACASGAGVTRLIVGDNLKDYVAPYLLESTLYTLPTKKGEIVVNDSDIIAATERLDALSVGMGMGRSSSTAAVVKSLLSNYTGSLIIDADGLNSISEDLSVLDSAAPKKIVLTPHAGEFSRLTGKSVKDISADPIGVASDFAKRHGVIVLLKGAGTVVTDGDNTVISDSGDAGLATAGSGDVLSGAISAFCGYLGASVETVAAAAYVCGRAADLARADICEISHTAGDTVGCLKRAITDVLYENAIRPE